MRKKLIAIATAGVLAAVAAAPALAHVTVVKRSPGKGATASTGVGSASVKFNAVIRSGTLKVYKVSNGVKYSIGNGARDPRNFKRVVTRLKASKPAGQYVARWRIVAADGHVQRGSWRFTLN